MKSLTASGIENRPGEAELAADRDDVSDEAASESSFEELSTGSCDRDRVTRCPRAALIGLKEVTVAASRDVERVLRIAGPLVRASLQRLTAPADGAYDRDHAEQLSPFGRVML